MSSFKQRIQNFILNNVDYTTEPYSIMIERQGDSVWDTTDLDGDFVIQASWPAGDDSPRLYERVFLSPNNNDKLKQELEEVFEDLNSRISPTMDDVSTEVSLNTSQDFNPEENHDGQTVQFDSDDIDFYAMYNVNRNSAYTDDGEQILDGIISLLSDMGESTVSKEDINKVSILFDDFKYCSPTKIECEFVTTKPSDYYDITSTEEYAEVLADTPEEKEEILNQTNYSVMIPFDVSEDVPEDLRGFLVSLMESRFELFTSAPENTLFEGESFVFEDGVESTNFWMYLPYRP